MRNPKTGEKMQVGATVVPTFTFGKGFKDACKQAYLEGEGLAAPLNGAQSPQ